MKLFYPDDGDWWDGTHVACDVGCMRGVFMYCVPLSSQVELKSSWYALKGTACVSTTEKQRMLTLVKSV